MEGANEATHCLASPLRAQITVEGREGRKRRGRRRRFFLVSYFGGLLGAPWLPHFGLSSARNSRCAAAGGAVVLKGFAKRGRGLPAVWREALGTIGSLVVLDTMSRHNEHHYWRRCWHAWRRAAAANRRRCPNSGDIDVDAVAAAAAVLAARRAWHESKVAVPYVQVRDARSALTTRCASPARRLPHGPSGG